MSPIRAMRAASGASPAGRPIGRTLRMALERIAPLRHLWRPTASNATVPDEVGGVHGTISSPASVIVREPAAPGLFERVQNRVVNLAVTWPSGSTDVAADQSITWITVCQAEDIAGNGLPAGLSLWETGTGDNNVPRFAAYDFSGTTRAILHAGDGSAPLTSQATSRCRNGERFMFAAVLNRADDTWRGYHIDDAGTVLGGVIDASAVGAVAHTLDGVWLAGRSTTGWDGQGDFLAVLDGAASRAQLEQLWTDLTRLRADRHQMVWDVGDNHAGQGIAWDADRGRWWLSNGRAVHEYSSTWDLVATHDLDAELTDAGITSTHIGAIAYGGGYVWGVFGADNSTCWLTRIDTTDGSLDAAWDLKNAGLTSGSTWHSSGDAIAYRESDGHLLYSTTHTGRLFELAIDDEDVVTEVTYWGLDGAGYGMPQGIRVVSDDRVLLTCATATSAPTTGIFLVDHSGASLSTVTSWTSGWDLPANLHMEGIELRGGNTLYHAEADRVVRYQLDGLAAYL